ncbi:dUTP diphosphatase [Candidatus Saccharibacteria bacterium]|nr:dUTP diphosphatase [Candidatus Saccharibacteria bacterium]MBJ58319.1 dUTP diphosphatase [Candidatus Saccharibacteria bacterium]MBQ69514.1 dUTP diphosphatase [Candidatus Saccharibacteria bacterium]|tara:strand:+ start:38 stop:493 length:456 start_codon:yes stop_codon:yes gene_type:complete
MNIRIRRINSGAVLPEYQTKQAAAMDIHACLDEPMVVQPMERFMVPTGLAFELPEGTEMQIRARSGLSIKHGITLINGVGTIDADYRGELNVLMINLGTEPFTIEPGMRVAQLLVARYETIAWDEVESLAASDRGSGGFGSTGFDKSASED